MVADDDIDADAVGLPDTVALRAFAPLVGALLAHLAAPPYAPALVEAALTRALLGRRVLVRRAGRDGLPVALRPLLVPTGAVRLHPRVAALCADGAAMDAVVVRGLYSAAANAEARRLQPARVHALHPPEPPALRLDAQARLGLLLLTRARAAGPSTDSVAVAIEPLRTGPAPPRFASEEALGYALSVDAIAHDAPVTLRIAGARRVTTAGRVRLWRELGARVPFACVDQELDEAAAWRLVEALAGADGAPAARWAACIAVERVGRAFAARSGFSLCLEDLRATTARLDDACAAALLTSRRRYLDGEITDGERYNTAVDLCAQEHARREDDPAPPRRDALDLLRRSVVIPRARDLCALRDTLGRALRRDGSLFERPVVGAPGRGLDAHDLALRAAWLRGVRLNDLAGAHALRRLVLRRVRELRDLRVVTEDCGAGPVRMTALELDGVVLQPLADRAAGRWLAADAVDERGVTVLAAGTLLGAAARAVLRARPVAAVQVRSPRGCTASGGLCARCYGAEDDEPVAVGARVGLRAVLAFALAARRLPAGDTHHIC